MIKISERNKGSIIEDEADKSLLKTFDNRCYKDCGIIFKPVKGNGLV